jgi:hypothetical protein
MLAISALYPCANRVCAFHEWTIDYWYELVVMSCYLYDLLFIDGQLLIDSQLFMGDRSNARDPRGVPLRKLRLSIPFMII